MEETRDILEVLEKLPPICAARHLSTGAAIIIKRGSVGYWPAPAHFDVEAFNARHGITAAQLSAMEIGSHFGFDAPGANPDNY